MSIGHGMASELGHEAAATRAHLEAIPEDNYGWKPHEKSMTMTQLASHIAEMIGWIPVTIADDNFDFNMAEYVPFKAQTRTELLAKFDENVKAAITALEGCSDEAMFRTWKMTSGGQTFMEMPRVGALRGMTLNHVYHHRGQLTVYLRLLDVPLAKTYGPTADDPSF